MTGVSTKVTFHGMLGTITLTLECILSQRLSLTTKIIIASMMLHEYYSQVLIIKKKRHELNVTVVMVLLCVTFCSIIYSM